MTTDTASTFEAARYDAAGRLRHGEGRRDQVYEQAGIGPEDVDVVELHDCFAHNELITYEALGLCPEGGAARFIDDGDNTYGGRSSPIPPAGCCRRAIRSARPGSRNASS